MGNADVKQSDLAGTWYPAGERELRGRVEGLLAEHSAAADPAIAAAIVPHAGYAYSGRAAAAAYAHLRGREIDRVVILAPSHSQGFPGAAVFPGSGFATPLGVVPVDREAGEALTRRAPVQANARPFTGEHSLEIQLPFLQVALPRAHVVPLLLGGGSDDPQLGDLGPALRELAAAGAFFVVSSDFTHYGERFDYLPFPPAGEEPVREGLRALDEGAFESIVKGDVEGFCEYVAQTDITVCGRGPIAAFLHAFGEALRGEVACYYTSLDLTGDFEHSVSYAAILFRRADA